MPEPRVIEVHLNIDESPNGRGCHRAALYVETFGSGWCAIWRGELRGSMERGLAEADCRKVLERGFKLVANGVKR